MGLTLLTSEAPMARQPGKELDATLTAFEEDDQVRLTDSPGEYTDLAGLATRFTTTAAVAPVLGLTMTERRPFHGMSAFPRRAVTGADEGAPPVAREPIVEYALPSDENEMYPNFNTVSVYCSASRAMSSLLPPTTA